MKAMDRATQENIFVSAYWPRRHADETNIGYGVSKDLFLIQLAGVLYSLTIRLLGTFVEPKVRPLIRPWVRGVLLLPGVLPGLSLAILAFIFSSRRHQLIGFYQLDDEGRPVLFLAPLEPETIRGRIGVSRRKFLSK